MDRFDLQQERLVEANRLAYEEALDAAAQADAPFFTFEEFMASRPQPAPEPAVEGEEIPF